jgi:23S rRNA (uracil1939-C5)-methyltransferase
VNEIDTGLTTLTVERVVAGGDGLARHDGLVVFVPRSLPGEQVAGRIYQRGKVSRLDVTQRLTESPDRVDPPCVHYSRDQCGGCQLQHASPAAQLSIKADLVVEAFARIGKRTIARPSVMAAPAPLRYRRKLSFAVRRRGTQWIGGMHRADAAGQVVPLDDCLLADPRVLDVWRMVLAAQAHFPEGHEGRASVRLFDDGAASFVFEGGDAWPLAKRFFDAVPALRSLWWHPTRGRRRLLHERAAAPTRDDASFVQVNEAVSSALRVHVLDLVRAATPQHVIDAYAGNGEGAAQLATFVPRVTAIELDADAAAVAASRLHDPSTVLVGRVEHRIADALPADLILVNPPRSGLDAAVPAAILAASVAPRRIIYVSCDPATLARDVARLPGWRVNSVVCFDMFPQTAHVETVCELVPDAS